ncbi:unnamed protein product [Moneuplotes crassus]|uniref:Uncharacterized protein n=1 Tax=Euplotes crassus TaxID=5936 RepID=A0AAD1XMK4_EUPCR|nr:unnamed protein product [Moneuplotes crassus]
MDHPIHNEKHLDQNIDLNYKEPQKEHEKIEKLDQNKTLKDQKQTPKDIYGNISKDKEEIKAIDQSKRKRMIKRTRSKSHSKPRFILDGVKQSQYGIPDFNLKSGISTSKFKRSQQNCTLRKNDQQSLPKLKYTGFVNEDIKIEKARRRNKTIIMENFGQVLKLKSNKSALLEYIKKKPEFKAGITRLSRNKILANPYLVPSLENLTMVHKKPQPILFPNLRSKLSKNSGSKTRFINANKKSNLMLKFKANESITTDTNVPAKKPQGNYFRRRRKTSNPVL